MPPARTVPANQLKRPRPPFKPPRPRTTQEPSNSNSKAETNGKSAAARRSKGRAPGTSAGRKDKGTNGRSNALSSKTAATTVSSSDESNGDADEATGEDEAIDLEDNAMHSARRERSPASADSARSSPARESNAPPIPQKLLTRLLYESFEDRDMKIGREAMNVFSKYTETFVREALARAVFERQDADRALGGDGFLQVEDLEKLAPQLLLDF